MIDLDFSNALVQKAIKKHKGILGEVSRDGANHKINFKIGDLHFCLIFDSRDGRKLLHCGAKKNRDVFQTLYGFKGDRTDTNAVMEWMNSVPGFGDIISGSNFLFICLDEYLTLEHSSE